MTDFSTIQRALGSTDADVIMQGYVDTLAHPDSDDRKTVLAFLLAKISTASGNLVLAEQIADNAYEQFDVGSPEEKAAADAYWGLFGPVKASGNLVLAKQIADNAYEQFDAGSPERKAAAKAMAEVRELRLLATPKTSALAGQGASSEVTLSQIAKSIRQIQAPKTPSTGSVATP